MAETSHRQSDPTTEPVLVRVLLIAVTGIFLLAFLVLPLGAVLFRVVEAGWESFAATLADPDTQSSIRLTLLVAAFAVPFNLVFGLAAAWAIAKFEFRGKTFFTTLIDLPFSVSPVISGLVYVLLFGADSFLGPKLTALGFPVVFAFPGIFLATVFVTFPFIARELIPLMETQGKSDEEAAISLGASGFQTFFRVTLPNVKWALLYGVLLCNARAMGEFGAVSVISGHVQGRTNTMPLQIEALYNGYDSAGAFAVASLLAGLALVTLILRSLLELRLNNDR
ncbi:sulfate ABC transporter permease subunit CysW [Allorhizobium sp. BGMRC 0089]|uniref:sulfate ABC transporter permease subunit CysW n=1 Tax=Allorhizobium sonneratiae TaxID=2934936 RepID=UPI0020349743|nr:sulfate ABC transporter permease subunit CysW [Allorhizobium sonneratiae]MCM2292467.1 sulfate ABC transporter permease subunit CysW [Allorhizobium sonneratiae]